MTSTVTVNTRARKKKKNNNTADCWKGLHFKYCSVKRCIENVMLQGSSGISRSENAPGEEN